jgi:hypothetical protein
VALPTLPKAFGGNGEVESILAEVGELLAVLAVKLESTSIEEMPALIDCAKQAARLAAAQGRDTAPAHLRCNAP